MKEEKCHREFYVFEDGTEIEKEAENVESQPQPINVPPKKVESVEVPKVEKPVSAPVTSPNPMRDSFAKEPALEYLKPRNDVPEFDMNSEKKYPIEKMDYFISLVAEGSTNPKKILQSRINKFLGVYDELKNVVDQSSSLKPSIYHHLAE